MIPWQHCMNRLFEWAMAVTLIFLGIHLMVWPHALAASAFRVMLNVIAPQHLAVFFVTVGIARAAALLANGQWPKIGPHLRAGGALCGAVIWLQMAIALLYLIDIQRTPPSPGIPVYSALFLAELIATYRAASDANYRRR